ncbi:MAG: hypothetical protein QOC81_2253 [Thermoanaerobaculia bacterium]|jgi:hypothetical protein|nr:hypothetical protein [Thermoanaerobaculia bacterium]
MAACETHALLAQKECGRLDRGHSGVLARVLAGWRIEAPYEQARKLGAI